MIPGSFDMKELMEENFSENSSEFMGVDVLTFPTNREGRMVPIRENIASIAKAKRENLKSNSMMIVASILRLKSF